MARITARQAFTRSKTKRHKSQVQEKLRQMSDARTNESNPRHRTSVANKKITDYFAVTRNRDALVKIPLKTQNFGTNSMEQVDEDIEIVEMLPPIPLRDHPIFEVEE